MPSIINSDDGVVSGTSGLKTTGGNDGILSIQNNGTTNITVNASGNVGFGTTSPDARVSLQSGGDVQMTFKDTGGTTRAYVGTSGAFGSAPTGALRIRSDQGGIVFGISGTETARLDTSSNFLFNSGYGSAAVAYGCRAWANFVGNGGVGNQTINASGNITSLTKNGTGDYSANLATSMPDANYSAQVFGGEDSGSTGNGLYAVKLVSRISSSFRFRVGRPDTGGLADYQTGMIAVFR